MPDELETEQSQQEEPQEPPPAEAADPEPEAPASEPPVETEASSPAPAETKPAPQPGRRPDGRGGRPESRQDPRPDRGKDRPQRDQRPGGDRKPHDRPQDRPNDPRGREGNRDRRPERRPEGPVEIEYDKLIADSLYLDNQAHILVSRLRDLDAGTRSQLRRLYGAVRRACRAGEADRQHQFVMLRARLAYTIARHGLRSLDPLEKLLLTVTRRNESRGYDRFRDLFEAIIAYNE